MTHSYTWPSDKSNTIIIIALKNIKNFRILFLKSTKLREFRRVGSKLLHSIIVEGKKEFLKKLCLFLKQGMLSTFLVAYVQVFPGVSLKRYQGLLFCKFCKTFLVFCSNVATEVTLNLILGKVFPSRYLVLHQLWRSRHYTD